MRSAIARSFGPVVLCALLFCMAAAPVFAGGSQPVATDSDRVAIKGYDTVAYFTDGKAIKGSSAYEYVWNDARWQFASAEHRDMFAADPDRYMPQFGGFCAGAIMGGWLDPANPESWTIVDGKLYMVAGTPEDMARWKAHAAENIPQGDAQWAQVQDRLAAQSP